MVITGRYDKHIACIKCTYTIHNSSIFRSHETQERGEKRKKSGGALHKRTKAIVDRIELDWTSSLVTEKIAS